MLEEEHKVMACPLLACKFASYPAWSVSCSLTVYLYGDTAGGQVYELLDQAPLAGK